MTPDEFDQKRRELIQMRTKYADREEVANRINNLIGLLGELQLAERYDGKRATLDKLVGRSLLELSQLTASQ